MRPRNLRIETINNILTYIIALIGFASVFTEVKAVYIILFVGLLTLSAYLTYRRRLVTKRWILNLLAIAVIVSALIRLDGGDLIVQMLEALLVLLCIKFLEQKKVRDHMQIYAISLLLVAGSGLLSLSVVFVVVFLLLLVVMTSASILLAYYSQDENMALSTRVVSKIVRNSLLIPCIAVPLTILIFIILPRTNYPLFSFMNGPEKAHSGFSDEVTLGTVSSIQETTAVVLRVSMEQTGDENLYWRGVVLDYFDGVSWKSVRKKMAVPTTQIPGAGRIITQTIYMEPYESRRLFALDKPVFLSLRNARQLDDGTFVSSTFFGRRLKYQAESVPSDCIGEKKIDRDRYLQLPPNVSARLTSLVRELGEGRTENEKVSLFHKYLAGGNFKYSLDNLPITRDPVDTFLFETGYGNCEYFASAYAVMLRISGVPSRIVGGYRGGSYNRVGNYYLVAEKDAHVWVEAYLKGRGWLRMDPTPALAAGLSSGSDRLLRKVSLLADAVNYYWYAFVINYNFEKQAQFVRSFKSIFRNPEAGRFFDKRSFGWVPYVGFIAAAFGLWYFLREIRANKLSAEDRILGKFLKEMKKAGYRKMPNQGLEEFAASVRDGGTRASALRFVSEFEGLYYRDKKAGKDQIGRLRVLLKSLRSERRLTHPHLQPK